MRRVVRFGILGLLVACGGDDGGTELPSELHCSGSDLEAALLAARPGTAVGVGRCDVAGEFIVPAGVTLIGASESESRILGTSGARAITLETGASGTTGLESLTILSDSRGAVAESDGAGAVLVRDVTVEITDGAGMAFLEVPEVTLTRVTLIGPATAEDGGAPGTSDPRPGLTILNAEKADLVDVNVTGMLDFGAYFAGSVVTWQGGSANENERVGVLSVGGQLTINDVEASDNFNGNAAGVFAGATTLISNGLVTTGNDRGVAQFEGTVHMVGCQLSDNKLAGITSTEGTLTCLETCTLAANQANGVHAVDSSGVELFDTTISGTITRQVLGTSSMVGPFAYGAQLIGSLDGFFAKDLTLSDNEMAGLLLDLSDPSLVDGTEFDSVTVTGSGDANGAILQSFDNGVVRSPDGSWDTNILRQGSTSANDLSLNNPLLIDDITVGITTPDI